MRRAKALRMALAVGLVMTVSACGVLEPRVPEARPDVPEQWPLPPTTEGATPASPSSAAAPGAKAVVDVGWRDFFVDPKLEELVARSLANNRDLRIAVLNVERARELYRIQRADRVPSIGAVGTMVRQGGDGLPVTETFSADLAVTGFELDLFGRVRSLSQSALQSYFAQEQARRSAQLSLIAELANVYLTLAADQDQMRLARETLRTREEAFRITGKRHEFGAVSALDVHQSRTQVETARADLARYEGQVAQDLNALTLLVGGPVEPELRPAGFDPNVTGLDALPPGLPSDVLLRRPDVLAAEHRLLAANANIGAARAAFFPSITLTGTVGVASDELSGLFDGGTGTWSFVPRINLPIFEGGRLRANLGVATADRDIALADYEGAIQRGFREVADALALTSTLAAQRQALEQLVEAARQAEQIARVRYEAGRDSYLTRLEAQRTLYVAEQSLITTRLAEQGNRITLYKVLGGGWAEGTP